MKRTILAATVPSFLLFAFSTADAQWVTYLNETSTRLVAAPGEGAQDPWEKDYAWGDVDDDGDIDLVSVRKQPFTSPGKATNVLYINEGGVLVDRTQEYATDSDVPGDLGFHTPTNDRDVVLVDVDGDGWLDIVTAVTISDGDPKHIGHPRIYHNKGAPSGTWLGFRYEDARIPTMLSLTGGNFNPRFCSVAAGDLTGDGKPELWFGDYDSAGAGGNTQPPGADFDDRLLINDGNGFFTDQTNGANSRFSGTINVNGTPFPFRQSAFGAAGAIADMNGDGLKDIVKQTSLNPPQYVGIAYNRVNQQGFFDTYQNVYSIAPYFVSVADLNNDGRNDLILTDDGTDRYLLNQGNSGGIATFIQFTFPNATDGFGAQSIAADLNNDGWKDVLIADVDVDIPPCGSRTADILRNNGNAPNVTFTADAGSIPSSMLAGVHNFAVFDIDGDGWNDLVVGRCSTTEIWINRPPSGIIFQYPQGTPTLLTPDEPFTFPVQANAVPPGQVQSGSGYLYYRVNEGSWVQTLMTEPGPVGAFEAHLPGIACAGRIDFYVEVSLTGGWGTFTGPPGAPVSYFSASAAGGTDEVTEDFENGTGGWTVVNHPAMVTGMWERADPNGTINGTQQAAPEDDAQAGTDKIYCFVTDDGPPGSPAGAFDVDNGPTHLISPPIDLTGTDATVSFACWVYSAGAAPDPLVVSVSNDDGQTWVQVDSVPPTNSAWQTRGFIVSDAFPGEPLSANVRVRFSIEDNPNNSITEAGIDVVRVSRYLCQTACACPGDVNGDLAHDGDDVQSFVECLLEGGSSCGCADLDNSNSVDAGDVSLFVDTILSGAGCAP